MKKSLLAVGVLIGFFPVLALIETGVNSLYAVSLRNKLKNVSHPDTSVLLREDWAVANCGNASNQCCFAYVEIRESKMNSKDLEAWYASTIGTLDLRTSKEYQLFLGDPLDQSGKTLLFRAFFREKYDDILVGQRAAGPRYSLGYIESGYPTRLDFRCH